MIDADTIEIGRQRIRLHGIDAPESGQTCQDGQNRVWRCGQQAALALSDLLGRRHVRCLVTGEDRYQRKLATCSLGDTDINSWLVRSGWALAYRRYSRRYLPEERQAKREASGLWQGSFMPPWEWRQQQRQTGTRPLAAAQAPAGCAIKGNISSKGNRIYHLPGSRWYDKTRINRQSGERWFCSESEARAAGWRKAR